MAAFEVNKKFKFVLTNGFKYAGIVISDDNGFLWIDDDVVGPIALNKSLISIATEVN